jgi:hypothetical protein
MTLPEMTPAVRRALFAAFAVFVLALAFFASRAGDDTPVEVPAPTVSNGDTVVVPGSDATSDATGDGQEPVGENSPEALPDLPVTAETIRSTKALAVKFAQAYTTYSYTQDDKAVSAALADMLDTNAPLDLTGVIPTGTFKASLVKDRHTATSVAKVTAVNTVSKNLIAYDVETTVTTTSAGKTSTTITPYLLTLTRESGWGVNDFHPVDTGLGTHGND